MFDQPNSVSLRSSLALHELRGSVIGLQETCIILPQLRLVFDTGRCPHRAVYQRTVLLTHAHMDHIGGLPFHISTRCCFSLTEPFPSRIRACSLREAQKQRQGELHVEGCFWALSAYVLASVYHTLMGH